MNKLEESFKNIFNSILENADNEVDSEHKEEIEKILKKIDLKDPEKLFFSFQYKNERIAERAVKLKMSSEGYPLNNYFFYIFYNFENLSHYLSGIVSNELGFTCSVDKANFVLRRIMEYELKGKTVFNKGSKKSFNDPFYRNFKLWQKVIKTCPIIDQRKASEHASSVLELITNIRKYKSLKNEYILNFYQWLDNTDFKYEQCEIDKNKSYTYEVMFKQDPINSFEWLKDKSPHILKIFKKTKLDFKHAK